MKSTPYPIEGVVSWNMNTICNYRCSYCTQRFIDDRKQWARDLPAFITAFSRLPGDWEIKLSGGEPFRHPDFLQGVEGLVNGGLRVSVVTNFSVSNQVLEDYARLTAANPGVFSASMHLEYVDPGAFLDRLSWFQKIFSGVVVATCVATRELLPTLGELQSRFQRKGVRLNIQPEKQDREVIAYTAQETTALLALGGHNGLGAVDPNYLERPCWAGARYFIVDHRGESYRCYPARRVRKEYLGNLLVDGFRLHGEAKPCQYTYCNCTVPQSRGMMPRETVGV